MGMWKKLFATVAGFGLAGTATAADPDFPNAGPFVVEQLPGRPAEPAAKHRVFPGLRGTRPPRQTSLEEEGFRGAVFEPRSSSANNGLVTAGGQNPEYLPDGDRPAEPVFDAIVPAQADVFDPAAARSPEEFVYGPPPVAGWRVWGGAEVLYGTGRSVNVPPLVTTGPASQGVFNAGALGQPGTVPLFGGQKLLDTWRAGVRGELGIWFNDRHSWGGVARFYSLFSTSEQFGGNGIGTNVLNLPQFVPVAGTVIQFPAYAGFPGVTTGAASTTAQTTFAGGDLSVRRLWRQGEHWRLDSLFGYRQLHLGDQLAAGFNVVSAQVQLPFSPILSGSDNVRTRNNFYGAHIGGIGSAVWKRWMVQGLGAVALGVNVTDLDYDRSRDATVAGAVTTVPLVRTSVNDRTTYFGVATESGVKVHFRVTDHARLTFGYTGLYWWNVQRAQEQYTLGPTLSDKMTRYSVHMLSWGAEFRY